VRWWVAGGEAPLFDDLDAALLRGRVVKDYRHKRTVECRVSGVVWLVKIYKPGGVFRRLKSRFLGSRARHELRMYLGVERRRIPTVPLAAVAERGAEGFVICRKLEGWRSVEEALLDPATPSGVRRKLADDYGRFARRLHDAGVWQYDFNPSNVLVDPKRPHDLRVIDFEKMKLLRSVSLESRLRSMAKINRVPRLSRSDRLRFFRSYFHDRDDLRDLLRRLRTRILRQTRHDAARIRRLCTRENRNFAPIDSPECTGWYRRRRPDHPEFGLMPEEVEALVLGTRKGYRVEPREDAISAWRDSNARAKEGSPPPLAVVRKRGAREGYVVYRA